EILIGRECHRRNHGLEVRWILNRRQPLDGARIGETERSYISIRPRLLRRPLDSVVTVSRFVFVRAELAGRSVTAAHVLHNNCVSALGGMAKGEVIPEGKLLAVRGAINQDWEFPCFFRQNHVRAQDSSIAHRHCDVFLDVKSRKVQGLFWLRGGRRDCRKDESEDEKEPFHCERKRNTSRRKREGHRPICGRSHSGVSCETDRQAIQEFRLCVLEMGGEKK